MQSPSTPSRPATSARTNAVRDIRVDHGRLEQILLLLVADPSVEDGVVSRFAADLTAHLEAEASVIYPVLERALGPLTALRKLQSRLQRALSRIALPGAGEAIRSDRLRVLHAALQEHSRFEERVALPVLETFMAPQSLEALGQELRAALRRRNA